MVNKFYSIAAIIVVIDQLLKYIVRQFVTVAIPLTSFFSISNIQNTGAGFGILPGQRILLILISLIVIVVIIKYFKKEKGLAQVSWALILGGAVGNVIDRILFGSVTDFLAFSFWPAFNVADMAVTVGVIILLWQYWKN
ncbi:signal peptidase II [archaeon]|nr:signal peptidase II [archaeon]|tara:strand:+ start:527 stop:943 length:417 start_codon:yes stop_codon:yes gene_type:complete